MNQNQSYCGYCGKSYKNKTILTKHVYLCELLHTKNSDLNKDDDEPPSQKKMYKMLLELGKKYNKLD